MSLGDALISAIGTWVAEARSEAENSFHLEMLMFSMTARRLKACACWNDEAAANAWNAAQAEKNEKHKRAGEREAARLWAQAKRLHAEAKTSDILF